MKSPTMITYGALALAIISEVLGSSFLLKSEQFTRIPPLIAMVVCYLFAFYMLSIALEAIPLGVAYAIWGGLGIVLTAAVGAIVFQQTLDFWAIAGILMIVGGVIVMNVFSKTVGH